METDITVCLSQTPALQTEPNQIYHPVLLFHALSLSLSLSLSLFFTLSLSLSLSVFHSSSVQPAQKDTVPNTDVIPKLLGIVNICMMRLRMKQERAQEI